MKTTIFLFAILLSQVSYGQSDSCDKFKKLVDVNFEAWNNEDPSLFDKAYHQNASDDGIYDNLDGLKSYARLVWENYSNTNFVLKEQVCGTDHIFISYHTTGYSKEHNTEYMGTGMNIFYVKDNKIIKSDGVLDIYDSLFKKGFTLQAPKSD